MLPDITSSAGRDWRLINYRRVSSLCAAEYLHDLYNRHLPEINSVRFRNTVVLYRDGSAWAFAPADEWACVADWFGGRLASSRAEAQLRAIDAYVERPHVATTELIECLAGRPLQERSGRELGELLLDLHYVTLGDIYAVNLVQIEHALTEAVRRAMAALFPPEVVDSVLAQAIGRLSVTVARTEENALLELVRWGLDHGCPELSEGEPRDSVAVEVHGRLATHLEIWAGVFRAYGTDQPDRSALIARYNELGRKIARDDARAATAKDAAALANGAWLEQVPGDVRTRIDLLRRVGELRDRNKALLGRVMAWRERLLGEIGARAGVELADLAMHTLRELCALAIGGPPRSAECLLARRQGVVLRREEGIVTGFSRAPAELAAPSTEKVLEGRCASRGTCIGTVRIVTCSREAMAMDRGEIMVSPGTDFDVLVGLQRAGAIVTEEGGVLSHAAVVAREYGVPCVVGVRNATTALASGNRVRVDADRGTVTILD